MRHNPAAGAIVIMLRALKMHGMAQAVGELTEQGSPAFEAALPILSQLLKAETADREVRSTAYQLKAARFPNYRDLAGFDFASSEVNEALVRQLHKTELHSRLVRQRECAMPIDNNISPPDPKLVEDPKHWRDKAEEARTKADGMTDAQAKTAMMRVADEYERLAKLVEATKRDSTPDRSRLSWRPFPFKLRHQCFTRISLLSTPCASLLYSLAMRNNACWASKSSCSNARARASLRSRRHNASSPSSRSG
jgi:hypothetical protein